MGHWKSIRTAAVADIDFYLHFSLCPTPSESEFSGPAYRQAGYWIFRISQRSKTGVPTFWPWRFRAMPHFLKHFYDGYMGHFTCSVNPLYSFSVAGFGDIIMNILHFPFCHMVGNFCRRLMNLIRGFHGREHVPYYATSYPIMPHCLSFGLAQDAIIFISCPQGG